MSIVNELGQTTNDLGRIAGKALAQINTSSVKGRGEEAGEVADELMRLVENIHAMYRATPATEGQSPGAWFRGFVAATAKRSTP